MDPQQSGLVDIVREFLLVHQLTGRLARRFRSGELLFEEVQALVGDSEESALFRLKERCHALFRTREGTNKLTLWRAALFDLAVGSLFHEVMKFRESFYQQEVYGPKVNALKAEAGDDADELFQEFEKILSLTTTRLAECLEETESLLAQTRRQFRVMLKTHCSNALVTRYLVENADVVEEIFEEGLDAVLADLHGSASEGYAGAARSYLTSGYFDQARSALDAALARSDEKEDLVRMCAYADGMSAYLAGRYGEAVDRLAAWVDAGAPTEASADLAYAAVSKVDQLLQDPDDEETATAAAALAKRIEPFSPRARSRSARSA